MITAGGKARNRGLNICVDGDVHSCPQRGHGNTPVTATSDSVKSNGKLILRVGDRAGCGAVITSGSPDMRSK